MAKKIEVTTESVVKAADTIEGLSVDYEGKYTELYRLAQELDTTWSGSDYTSFMKQIGEYQTALKHMKSLMDDFAAHCRKSAQSYKTTQDEITTKTKSLPTTY
ncbi:MAG: WXG100 family type VII secretion target [Clostridia bacterium]|nr:WXG100 family type VII secretion target [Clostridia bacterium]